MTDKKTIKWTAKYTIVEFLNGKKVREYEVSEEYMRGFLAGQQLNQLKEKESE